MPDQRRHRGPHPEDELLFEAGRVRVLRAAVDDLSWLLTREYAAPSALKLVGDRYQLAARQRTAVSRCACSDPAREWRAAKRRLPDSLAGEELWIDGYNVVTTLEAALSGGVILRGRDGCLRDMASMHGSYRQVTETRPAIEILGDVLSSWSVGRCRWLLDQPVSNSGRLRGLLLELAEQHGWEWRVDLVPDPDPVLARSAVCVATADSQILDGAESWAPLAVVAVTERVPGAWVVNLG